MADIKRSIILYHAFTPFEGDSTETRPIGGSESAMILMMREMATLGWDARVFCNCQNEGVFSGVAYHHSSRAREMLSSQPIDVFISQSNTDIFKGSINSKLNIFWMRPQSGSGARSCSAWVHSARQAWRRQSRYCGANC